MKNYYKKIRISIILFLSSCACTAADNIEFDFNLLKNIDQKHQSFSNQFHKKLTRKKQVELSTVQNMKDLNNSVKNLVTNGKEVLATAFIIKNTPLLKQEYNDFSILNIIEILLENNERQTAEQLFKMIKEDADFVLVAHSAYLFAKDAFEKNNWNEVNQYLTDIIRDLASEKYHHALLMQGISYQKLAQHKVSINSYEKIPQNSKYYKAAQFNIAIANIRQGFWSDGHIIIKKILQKPDVQTEENTLNKLYLTVGFLLLKEEYYRNAREAFRMVGLNSNYTNRALLGIALAAANQYDYVGALNATRILKQKKELDLEVDESHLLMPYFYEKLQQHTTASTGYSEAVNYYQNRIVSLNTVLQLKNNIINYSLNLHDDKAYLTIDNNVIHLSEEFPYSFFKNYLKLNDYENILKGSNEKKLVNNFQSLKFDYQLIIEKMVMHIVNKKIKHLNSYMDQSRFGLARLYDNNLVRN